jgi:hypothetical protein
MNLKKFLTSSLVTAAIAVSVPCFAQIAPENMVVGGLYIGQSYSDVMFIYDKPSGELKYPAGAGRVFAFVENGTEFNVRFINDKLAAVEVTEKNSLSTKAGIRIGSTLKDVKKAYGKPDEERKMGNEYAMYYKHYTGENHTWILSFRVKDGKVFRIELDDIYG